MGTLEKAKDWLVSEATAEQRAAVGARMNPPGGLLAAINAVAITGRQMQALYQAIQRVEVNSQTYAIALRAFADQQGFQENYAVPALHARVVAMDRWCQVYVPFGQTDVEAFFEAGAVAPLKETAQDMVFEPAAFADFIADIAEMPLPN